MLVSHDGSSHDGLSSLYVDSFYVDSLSYSPGYFFPVHDLLSTPDTITLYHFCHHFSRSPVTGSRRQNIMTLACEQVLDAIIDGLYMCRRIKNGKRPEA